ncbi:BlaI/MecI/CopY family transcriptional regulator [Singulisphaera sp. PoT]|uniref:BlaI/MecI/CopY family transcriptional regulator n=1 Tax=Singulisphaera sp. PoT TaxID=3411797 RepID=UPI003BF569AE
MNKEIRADLSTAEREVLKALWELGTGTVRQVNTLLNGWGKRWAYTTVLTLLSRLQTKGYVDSDSTGVAHVFKPTMSRDEMLERRLKDTADELCNGSAAPLILALVNGNRFTAEEIARFRRLLDEAGGGQGPPRS